MIYRISGISKLAYSFYFCNISATFIAINRMAFTEDLFYSMCCYSYWVLVLELCTEALTTGQLHYTRHQKRCLLFPQTSSWASILLVQPAPLHSRQKSFFLRTSVMSTWATSVWVRPWETEPNLLVYVISASSPPGPHTPVTGVWFLLYSR